MPDIQAFVQYLEERRKMCGVGSGYSFVRELPPSIRDTYFAMSCLKMLGLPPRDGEIVLFLSSYDHYDLNSGYYARKCLELAGAEVDFRKGHLWWSYRGKESIRPCFVPATPIINYFKYDLYGAYGSNIFSSPPNAALKRIELGETPPNSGLANLAYRFLKNIRDDNITTLYMALSILRSVNSMDRYVSLPSGDIHTIKAFLRRCTTRKGYVASPAGSSITLESVYAGHKIARYLRLPEPSGISSFVDSLQNANGGFRRSPFGGISSLEYSYLALSIISEVDSPSKCCFSQV